MKLSDIKGEQTFEVLGRIADPVSRIVGDKAVTDVFRGRGEASGKLASLVPLLVNNHRSDVVQVLAAIDGCTPDEYLAKTSFASLMKDVYELFTDEAFTDFLA